MYINCENIYGKVNVWVYCFVSMVVMLKLKWLVGFEVNGVKYDI